MRIWKPLIAGLLLGAAACQASAQQAVPEGTFNEAAVKMVMRRAIEEVIRPGYRTMQQSAALLADNMNGLCAAPSLETLAAAKSAFADTIRAWSLIEIVQTGPVLEKNRFEHILFYPDRKGVGQKQVQALIAKADPADATVEAVAGKSVALQSLTALEFVLFGTGGESLSTETNSFRCRYGAAVAGNIANVTAELSNEWDDPNGVSKSWENPGKDSQDFADGKEAVTALLGILVHGAENVRDQRLESFYKGKHDTARPKMAIYWRSGNTWTSVEGNLQGLRALWEKAAMADLLPADKREVVARIEPLFEHLIGTAKTVDPDVEAALASDVERAKIETLLSDSRDLTTTFSDGYGSAIGLSAGFSFGDGD